MTSSPIQSQQNMQLSMNISNQYCGFLNCSFKVFKIKQSKDASRMQYDHFRNLLTAINSWIWFKLSEESILSGAGGRACLTCSLLAANSWGTCSNCTNTGISPIHSTCAYCVTYGTLRWGENKKRFHKQRYYHYKSLSI